MPANTLPRTELSGVQWSAADMTPGLATRFASGALGTIATTGNTDVLIICPCAGTVVAATLVGAATLAQSDTAFITMTVTNLGQAGAGNTALLATSPAGINTTKVTGGAAITANVPFGPMVLSATAANLVVAKGDVLRVRAAATGTLANTVPLARIEIEISPS